MITGSFRSKSNASNNIKELKFLGDVLPKDDNSMSISQIKTTSYNNDKSDSTIKNFSSNLKKKDKVK